MKTKDLIAELLKQNQDAEVHFAYDYGDYTRTEVASAVTNVVNGYVAHSAYHDMPKVVDATEGSQCVVVLRATEGSQRVMVLR